MPEALLLGSGRKRWPCRPGKRTRCDFRSSSRQRRLRLTAPNRPSGRPHPLLRRRHLRLRLHSPHPRHLNSSSCCRPPFRQQPLPLVDRFFPLAFDFGTQSPKEQDHRNEDVPQPSLERFICPPSLGMMVSRWRRSDGSSGDGPRRESEFARFGDESDGRDQVQPVLGRQARRRRATGPMSSRCTCSSAPTRVRSRSGRWGRRVVLPEPRPPIRKRRRREQLVLSSSSSRSKNLILSPRLSSRFRPRLRMLRPKLHRRGPIRPPAFPFRPLPFPHRLCPPSLDRPSFIEDPQDGEAGEGDPF